MSDDQAMNFGPLTGLIGTWAGGNGMDVVPESDGIEHSPFFETLIFEAVGDVTNAGEQTLMVLRYHQSVSRQSNGEVFHDETGYWMWDEAAGIVMHSLVIPRGVALLAGGGATTEADGTVILQVEAGIDNAQWGIVQSPFMQEKARTTAFTHNIRLSGDSLSYNETTTLEIYGSTFAHTDKNELTRQS